MGSKVIKIDQQTVERLKNKNHYSDIDMFKYSAKDAGELPMAYDIEAVKMSVRNILMWRVGENILRPRFGHNIHRSMYEQLTDTNKEMVCQEIQRAIEDNETRVKVKSVAVKSNEDGSDDEENTLKVRVVYQVIGDKTKDSEFVEQASISGK